MSKMWRVLSLLFVLGMILAAGGAVAQEPHAVATELPGAAFPNLEPDVDWEPGCPPEGCDHVKGRVLIKLAQGMNVQSLGAKGEWTADEALDEALSTQGVLRLESMFSGSRLAGSDEASISALGQPLPEADLGRWYRAVLQDEEADVHAVARRLGKASNVEYAEPDYIAYPAEAPNDPRYGEQWGLGKIQIEEAWTVVTGTKSVVIAIADSGIDLDHPDLLSNLWSNPGEIPENAVDDDNNGYVDDVRGWNFVAGSNDVWDDNGHGTLVAGIATARMGNGIGIAGVAGGCRIMPVKVMQPSGAANYSDIATGIVYATDKGARVINLSLGGYAHSQALQDAITYAASQNVVVVGGAGNDSANASFYPAAYDDVIAVGGTTITDTRISVSNHGTWVDVSAPGEDILTTALGSDYVSTSGTSAAAPFASGLAGLMLSLHPDWTPSLVRSQLMQTADPIDHLNPGYEGQLGSGRVNANCVIVSPEPVLAYAGYAVNGTPNGRPDFDADATLSVSISSEWADVLGVTGLLSTTDAFVTVISDTADYGDLLSGQSATGDESFSIDIAAGAGYNHPIQFSLALSGNGGGYTPTLTFTVTTRSSIEPVVGDRIETDTTWTSDKTYLLDSNVSVMPGITLTIAPGTVVSFDGDYSLEIGGTLIADGTPDEPIVFTSNTGAPWNQIYFHDLGTDAEADGSGVYQSGCILRHVQVQGAANGIVSGGATPYLAHLSVDSGGVNCCWRGDTPVWLLDSSISGDVCAGGDAHVLGNSIMAGDLSVDGGSEVLTNTIVGGISAGGWATVRSNRVRAGGISAQDGSIVEGNSVEDSPGTGIATSGSATITGNRVVGSGGTGVTASGGLVQGNLIANCGGDGLHVGVATVISNTFTGIRGRALYASEGAPLKVQDNNFELNPGPYDIYNSNPFGQDVDATGNWWGTTDTGVIDARIYDSEDDWSLGQVAYAPVVGAPCSDAPAYVRAVTLDPASPVGIQTVAFEVEFSRAMDSSVRPEMCFYTSKRDSWTIYTEDNRPWVAEEQSVDWVHSIGFAPDGVAWLGLNGGVARYDGTNWHTYHPGNSYFPCVYGNDIAFDSDGTTWFATGHSEVDRAGLIRFDGVNWTLYNMANSGIPSTESWAIAIEGDGTIWLGTEAGVARFDRSNWTVYNSSNSGLPNDRVVDVAIDSDGAKWFGTDGGVARFDGLTWTVYDSSNSVLPYDQVEAIAIEEDGTKWFGCGVVRFDGTKWTVYNNAGPLRGAIAIHQDGAKWFGTGYGAARFDDTIWTEYNYLNSPLVNWCNSVAIDGSGTKWLASGTELFLLHDGPDYCISDDPRWLDDTHYRATYDLSALIPRETYSVTVSSSVGTDDTEIAPYSGITFTVDYAGGITDSTPPDAPDVIASGRGNTTIAADWIVSDPESPITLYRYAIGTSPGGTEVVNWTTIATTEVERSGLNLVIGQTYYVSVRARNEGGLWSESGVSNGVVAEPPPVPSVGTVTPGSGSCGHGVKQIFTTTASHSGGWQDIRWLSFAIGEDFSGTGGMKALYNQNANKVSLMNDAGTQWIGGYAPGSDQTIETSMVILHVIDMSALGAGDTLTVTWAVTFKSTAVGDKHSFMNVTDDHGLVSGWQQMGDWTVLDPTPVGPIPLVPGWNLISVPGTPASTALEDVLSSIDGQYDLVHAYDTETTTWNTYQVGAPPEANTLTDIDETMGFWVRATESAELTVSDCAASSASISLYAGWNLVGYPVTATRPISEALASIAGQYTLVYAYDATDTEDPWKRYDPGVASPFNDLVTMDPGHGYWILAVEDCLWDPRPSEGEVLIALARIRRGDSALDALDLGPPSLPLDSLGTGPIDSPPVWRGSDDGDD